jgi:hypothetical protein
MLKIEQLISFLPEAIKTQPKKFSPQALTDLDKILSTLQNQTEAEQIQNLKNWFKTHKQERDWLNDEFQSNRELGQVPRPSQTSEAEIRQNLFELMQIRQVTPAPPTNSPKP